MDKKIPLWLDCDIGVDDAAAMMLLCAIPQYDFLGISTVAGNVEEEKTFRNGRAMIEYLKKDVPVYPGAKAPLFRELKTAYYVHGKDGLGGCRLPAPKKREETLPAWDAIYEAAKKYPGELTLVAIGPLTNVALALSKYGSLCKLLKQIVLMGGSASWGNATPAAEFNIYVDPEAAAVVFQSGVPIVMCGLDVTLKAYMLPEELEELGALNDKGKFIRDSFQTSQAFALRLGLKGAAFHDPCAALYPAYPELFSGEEAGVAVETKGSVTLGKTVTDLYSDKQFPFKNAFVVLDVKREALLKTVFSLIASLN